jgi:hypothetical protein
MKQVTNLTPADQAGLIDRLTQSRDRVLARARARTLDAATLRSPTRKSP